MASRLSPLKFFLIYSTWFVAFFGNCLVLAGGPWQAGHGPPCILCCTPPGVECECNVLLERHLTCSDCVKQLMQLVLRLHHVSNRRFMWDQFIYHCMIWLMLCHAQNFVGWHYFIFLSVLVTNFVGSAAKRDGIILWLLCSKFAAAVPVQEFCKLVNIW